MKIVDRDKDEISDEDLPNLLLQYKNDSLFYIELIFRSGVMTTETVQVEKSFSCNNNTFSWNNFLTSYNRCWKLI